MSIVYVETSQPRSVRRGLNVPAKRVHQNPPEQSTQADTSRKY